MKKNWLKLEENEKREKEEKLEKIQFSFFFVFYWTSDDLTNENRNLK